MKRLLVALASWLVLCSHTSGDTIYTIVADTGFGASPYGFSGTIRTDGSTGTLTTTTFITSWSITLETPGGSDGVTSQVLTPANSSISSSFPDASALFVTGTDIGITDTLTFDHGFLRFASDSTDEDIVFLGSGTTDGGFVTVADQSEIPSLFSGPTATGTIPIASGGVAVVPEPSSLAALTLFALAGGFCSLRRRWTNRLKCNSC